MITYYTSQDLLEFGTFVLSEHRKQMQEKHLDVASLPQRLKTCNSMDIQAFLQILAQKLHAPKTEIKAEK